MSVAELRHPWGAVRALLAVLALALSGLLAFPSSAAVAQPGQVQTQAQAQRAPLQLTRQPQGLSAVSRLQFFEDTTRALTIEQVRTPEQEARFGYPNDPLVGKESDRVLWFKMQMQLADPADRYKKKGVATVITEAIDDAERFHVEELGSYYHPNTYAFYGADPARRTFSRISWIADDKPAQGRLALSAASIVRGKAKLRTPDGGRGVDIDGCMLTFFPDAQDAAGDGTVPEASGLCTGGVLRQRFATRGYSHQKSYDPDYMVLLTQHLVVKIVQGMK